MPSNAFDAKGTLTIEGKGYAYTDLSALAKAHPQLSALPYSIRVLLENALRHLDGFGVQAAHIESILDWNKTQGRVSIPFCPERVLMQDFTGVPAVVDMASLRAALARKGLRAASINPRIPVDLVIDHSIQVDHFGSAKAQAMNVAYEYARNQERYQLLKWAEQAFTNFRVVPPAKGICHQVNIEYLAQGVLARDGVLFPDTLVGTDSHTPMVNALGVLGWGVGGIEAEAAMLGQPLYMTLPSVIGLKLTGALPEGATATDLVLTLTHLLRDYGVVGCFVEVFGDALDGLRVPDRATIANMSPEFGCTDTHFPVDAETLAYLRRTNRASAATSLETYAKANGLWRNPKDDIAYTDVISLDLGTVESTLSGPRRPQDKIGLREAKKTIISVLKKDFSSADGSPAQTNGTLRSVKGLGSAQYAIRDGSVVMAAITSCTNTSNPSVMIGAGLLAKAALTRGLKSAPWVKTSLAPGSQVVTRYLKKAKLLTQLEQLGFHVVGYGCTTCIGNSGDMLPEVQQAVLNHKLIVASVLSGNRNFEARIHPHIRMNFLASPLLVVAYAIAGRMDIDLYSEPIGQDTKGKNVFLKDIWPTTQAINDCMAQVLSPADFQTIYQDIFEGDADWLKLASGAKDLYAWHADSTYVQEAPFFKDLPERPASVSKIQNARVLLQLGDMVTTDHISPAGKFSTAEEAGAYLSQKGVQTKDFNSYGARRGNHEVMMRGTFANVRIRNQLVDKEGGYTRYFPTNEVLSVYEAAMRYQKKQTPLVVVAGKAYGSGSSRDWAAKGTALLGVRAVIAESFERIHRANLVGMGVLPLVFQNNDSIQYLQLTGEETYTIPELNNLKPNQKLSINIQSPSKGAFTIQTLLRLESDIEIAYYRHGGILPYVLRAFLNQSAT